MLSSLRCQYNYKPVHFLGDVIQVPNNPAVCPKLQTKLGVSLQEDRSDTSDKETKKCLSLSLGYALAFPAIPLTWLETSLDPLAREGEREIERGGEGRREGGSE